MKNNLFFVTLCLFLSTAVQAQWTNNVAINTQVSDVGGVEESVPMSATTTDGRTYISYFKANGGAYDLYLQLLDVQGNKLFGAGGLLVSNQPQSSAIYRYDLKVDHENNAIVAFQDLRQGSNMSVSAYKITPGGGFAWGVNGVNFADSLSAEGLSPSIAVNDVNEVLIAWNAYLGNSKWVSYQKLTSAGNQVYPSVKHLVDPTNTKKYSRPVPLPGATASAFMLQYVQESGNFPGVTCTMYANAVDVNGNLAWTVPVQVSTKTISFFFFPTPVPDGKGGFYLAFDTSNPVVSSFSDVYVQHVGAGGSKWSATGVEADPSSSEQKFYGGFAYDVASQRLCAQLQVTDGAQGQAGISVQYIDTAGVLVGPSAPAATVIFPKSASIYDPDAVVAGNNNFYLIWHVGALGIHTISAAKIDLAAGFLWPSNSVDICTAASGKDDLTAGTFLNNQIAIVWDDTRSDMGVYAQNITAAGLTGVVTGLEEASPKSASAKVLSVTNEQVQVQLSDYKSPGVDVRILDSAGRTVRETRNQARADGLIEVFIDFLEAGCYFLDFKGVNLHWGSGFIKP